MTGEPGEIIADSRLESRSREHPRSRSRENTRCLRLPLKCRHIIIIIIEQS